MATSKRSTDPPALECGETPDEPDALVEAADDGDPPDYFFWGINELYVAP